MINERTILNGISGGDEQAFRLLFNQYKNLVYSYALRVLKSHVSAEEVLHDIFLLIWQDNNLVRIENIEAYLRTITRNHVLKILRRQQLEERVNRKLSISWTDTHNDLEEKFLLKESRASLNEGINMLPPQQKLAYHLCHELGLKYSEAAEKMEISPFTVKTHMQHALRFLRKYLDKCLVVTTLLLFLTFR